MSTDPRTITGDLELTISNFKVLDPRTDGVGSGPPPGMVSGFIISSSGKYIGPSPKTVTAMNAAMKEMGTAQGMDTKAVESMLDAQAQEALAGMSEQYFKPLWNTWVGQWIGVHLPDSGPASPFASTEQRYSLPGPMFRSELRPVTLQNKGSVPGTSSLVWYEVVATDAKMHSSLSPFSSSTPVPKEWRYSIQMEPLTMLPHEIIVDTADPSAPKPYASYEFKWEPNKTSK